MGPPARPACRRVPPGPPRHACGLLASPAPPPRPRRPRRTPVVPACVPGVAGGVVCSTLVRSIASTLCRTTENGGPVPGGRAGAVCLFSVAPCLVCVFCPASALPWCRRELLLPAARVVPGVCGVFALVRRCAAGCWACSSAGESGSFVRCVHGPPEVFSELFFWGVFPGQVGCSRLPAGVRAGLRVARRLGGWQSSPCQHDGDEQGRIARTADD